MATATGSYATTTALKSRLGITDATDDTLLGTICDQVNAYIEGPEGAGRIIAPISGTPTYLYDVDEVADTLEVPEGVRTVTLLEIAAYTDAAYETIAAADYFLRPIRPYSGWPYTKLRLSDRPTGSYSVFPKGFEVVRLTGTFGFAAIPDDVTDVALTAATRAWHSRKAGQTDIIGTDEMGRPLVSRFFSQRDRETIRAYSVHLPG